MLQTYKLPDDNLAEEKIFMARLMAALSIILFISGIGLDYISAKSTFNEILYIRVVLCISLAFTYIATYFREFFLNNYSFIAGGIYGIAAFGIIMMIYHTNPKEIAYQTYFAGLMLVIVTVFLGTYIDTISSIAISSMMIGAFLVVSLIARNNPDFNLIMNNVFFLSASVITGIISNSMRNKFLADRLFLQERLKTALRDEQAVAEEKTYLANIDELTGLSNRRHSRERLRYMLADAKKLEMSLVIFYMDLDKFKIINDAYGHNTGDEVLRIAARRLKTIMRKGDLISRQGGDEFLLAFLINRNELDAIDNLKKKIPEVISKPMQSDGLRFAVGASIGSSVYPTNGTSISSLIDIADHNMYVAKRESRDKEESPLMSPQPEDYDNSNNEKLDLSFSNKIVPIKNN